jgi:hypothetical protein
MHSKLSGVGWELAAKVKPSRETCNRYLQWLAEDREADAAITGPKDEDYRERPPGLPHGV